MTLVLPNPWMPELWNVTAQGAFVARHGLALAKLYARAAGVELGATKPATGLLPKVVHVTAFTKRIIHIAEGNRGFSGEGPPGETV